MTDLAKLSLIFFGVNGDVCKPAWILPSTGPEKAVWARNEPDATA